MERTLLVIALIALCALAAYGLSVGWRHRAARQSGLARLPLAPADLGSDLAQPLTGLYISTTTAGNWQDRIVAQGLGRRAAGAVRLSAEGVCIERDGEADIFVPAGDLVEVTTAPGIAGKVMGTPDGVLILRWQLADTTLDSGFRATDPDAQADFIEAARALIAGRTDQLRTASQGTVESRGGDDLPSRIESGGGADSSSAADFPSTAESSSTAESPSTNGATS